MTAEQRERAVDIFLDVLLLASIANMALFLVVVALAIVGVVH